MAFKVSDFNQDNNNTNISDIKMSTKPEQMGVQVDRTTMDVLNILNDKDRTSNTDDVSVKRLPAEQIIARQESLKAKRGSLNPQMARLNKIESQPQSRKRVG